MKKVKAIITNIREEAAVVSAQELSFEIPQKLLPEKAKQGDTIFITINNSEEETIDQEKTAKNLLNEVLSEG